MSSLAGAPNPCLLGILLIAQTRSGTGAEVLFHYPPDPLADDAGQLLDTDGVALDESSSSDSDSESSSDDNVYEVAPSNAKEQARLLLDLQRRERSPAAEDDDDEQSSKLGKVRSNEIWSPSWEPLLGIGEEGLVSLLAPGRSWHKRKFELGINDLVFVGRPVYARESGSWRKRRRRKQKPRPEKDREETSDSASEDGQQDQTDESSYKSDLTMFHVVFVMNPPPLEHTLRVKNMYDNVVRKLSKVLRTEQMRNDYVLSEADVLQSITSEHLTKRSPTMSLYSELLKKSSLATALATVYKAISTSRIAAVSLGSEISLSLQIPPVTSTPYLPSLTETPIQPGLWLTTANEPTDSTDLENTHTTSSTQLAKSFTLLLREPPHKILKDIQATGGPLPPQLIDFIATLRPSKSFHKISQTAHLPLADIQLLSRHLIYWRRAIAIPPLHHRDTYIVSPNCDLSSLATATAVFATSFAMLPSLPRLLSILSTGPPIPFGTLIPSSDHKEEYYRVLAWLLRGGWVTQLRTFAYVRVSPAIKAAAREHERSEKLSAAHSGLERLELNPRHQPPKSTSSNPHQQLPSSNSNASSFSDHHHHHPATLPPSAPHRPSLISRPSSESTTARSSIHAASISHSNTTTATTPHNPSLTPPRHASLILSPLRATPLESSWLARIHASLLTADIADLNLSPSEKQSLHAAWPTLLKYFNGTEPLEGVSVREGWKRKQVWALLGELGIKWGWDVGVADTETGERRGVVVTVRHW